MDTIPDSGKNTIQVIDRAVAILNVLSQSEHMQLTQVARSTQLPASTTSRILGSLVSHGLIEQDLSGQYRLGGRLLVLASRVRRARDLVEIAGPSLTVLVNATGEDVGLAVLEREHAVVIDSLYGPHALKIIQPRADSLTLNCGYRKVLLAYQGDDWIKHYLRHRRFPTYTKSTITSPAGIWREIRLIREQGYALSRGEGIEDAGGVAAPIFSNGRTLVACVFVTAPLSRLTPEVTSCLVERVLTAAQAISAAIPSAINEVLARVPKPYKPA